VLREGMFFGVNGFIIRFAFSMQGLATAAILGLTGYIASSDTELFVAQPASAVLGLRVLTAGLPLLASLVVIGFLYAYPLHGRRLSHLRQRQAELHPATPAAAAD
jgi:GPH family glycoside/pentoside/hexuronide:cation symporter